jgi:hypothetical protein
MPFSEILTQQLPVVVVRFSDEEPDAKAFEAHLQRMYQLYASHHNIVVVFDTRKARYLSSENRIRQGKWLKEHHSMVAAALKGAAYVASGAMAQMILKGIFLIQKPDWPHKVFTDYDKAIEWAESMKG